MIKILFWVVDCKRSKPIWSHKPNDNIITNDHIKLAEFETFPKRVVCLTNGIYTFLNYDNHHIVLPTDRLILGSAWGTSQFPSGYYPHCESPKILENTHPQLTYLFETPNFRLKRQNFARNFLVDDRRLSWRLRRDLIIFFGSFSSSEPRKTFLEGVDPLLHLQVFVDEFGPETKYELRNVVTSVESV